MYDASIKEVLSEILTRLSLPFQGIEVADEGEFIRVDVVSNDASRLIGWHGETLNAVQHITKSMVRAKEGLEQAPFIIVDVDGYRRSQEDKVRKMADQKADFVRRTGTRVALSPMSPYFRRIVHLYIAENASMQDLTTESVGEGDYRQVVLKLKKASANNDKGELSPVLAEKKEEKGVGFENLDV
jgi:spoIIIJ-associated protein